jgi:hypothetical protein
MKGCSSLGRLRFAVLLAVKSKKAGGGSLCLIGMARSGFPDWAKKNQCHHVSAK